MVFLVMNNGSYSTPRRLAQELKVEKVPGLNVPGIDFCALDQGYGMMSSTVNDTESLRSELDRALGLDKHF